MGASPLAEMPPPAARPAALIAAVRAASEAEGVAGAWQWALYGTCPSPITGRPARGVPPAPAEMIAEAKTADGEVIPLDQRIYDTDPQLAGARRILEWVSGICDEIPLPPGDRGRFIGARDDYARTDEQIRTVLSWARSGLAVHDLPASMDPVTAMQPWRWPPTWQDAAWLRGVTDLLAWVCGERDAAPLSGERISLPSLADAGDEYGCAYDVLEQGRPGGQPVQPSRYPPPQYGEAIQAAYDWLCGARTIPPVDRHGHGAYFGCRDRATPCTCTPVSFCPSNGCQACAFSLCALSREAA
jgi:hypothetical protein